MVKEIEYQEHFFPGTRQELLNKLKQSVKEKRYRHILGVEQTAISLAEINQVDLEKASVAGLVHDYAKERTTAEFKAAIQQYQLDSDLLNWGNFIWHGVVGAEIIRDELKITDPEILNAVRRHTVGAVKMTKLDKLIYVADFIEPSRDFPDVEFARSLAFADLDQAVRFETKHTLEYLVNSSQTIYPPAIDTYNQWVVKK
ncbi:bis(5'-nucleosyl)-tetraphosphatase (symmetrical) YqeK [Liquorilactobacillus vini]|uniref:bis(5'-nucleosyl)-tetraphosphatase (symmetrical) n=2 Tax=Liquorilactobacillus vini TaxID=238015 RepID=A0A0R2CN95_9LACO|nr:bis(5'-nucleosyl)-tetraphosphatase (symmetrical) YqeK [Liquorilactobacillus vini]KRM89788.1 HD superfamily hydrolase [Liquorilactobacillus vini DSM 20605]